MLVRLAGFLFLALTACAADASQLAFLSGCWVMNRNGVTVEEMWNKPTGGALMGMGRTVSAAGKVTESEFVEIRPENGVLSYVVQLKLGGPVTVFPVATISATEVVFSNPEHDFPQRIIYRALPDGNLFARVEGRLKGKDLAQEYLYQRGNCQ
jgi:hypothetical protein